MNVWNLTLVLRVRFVLHQRITDEDRIIHNRSATWLGRNLVPVVVNFDLHLLIRGLASERIALKGVGPNVADWVIVRSTGRVWEILVALLDRNDVNAIVLLD